jgi:hypothetical protein
VTHLFKADGGVKQRIYFICIKKVTCNMSDEKREVTTTEMQVDPADGPITAVAPGGEDQSKIATGLSSSTSSSIPQTTQQNLTNPEATAAASNSYLDSAEGKDSNVGVPVQATAAAPDGSSNSQQKTGLTIDANNKRKREESHTSKKVSKSTGSSAESKRNKKSSSSSNNNSNSNKKSKNSSSNKKKTKSVGSQAVTVKAAERTTFVSFWGKGKTKNERVEYEGFNVNIGRDVYEIGVGDAVMLRTYPDHAPQPAAAPAVGGSLSTTAGNNNDYTAEAQAGSPSEYYKSAGSDGGGNDMGGVSGGGDGGANDLLDSTTVMMRSDPKTGDNLMLARVERVWQEKGRGGDKPGQVLFQARWFLKVR